MYNGIYVTQRKFDYHVTITFLDYHIRDGVQVN